MRILYLTLLVSLIVSFSSCENNLSNGVVTEDEYIGAWDCPVGDEKSLDYLFTVKIQKRIAVNAPEDADSIIGEVTFNTTTAKISGQLNGKIKSDSITFITDFTNDANDFTFKGIKTLYDNKPSLQGKLTFINVDGDQNNVIMSKGDSVTCKVDSTINPNNPYLLMQVSSTPNPTAPPVIFIHGMTATYREWDSLIADLNSDFKSRHNIYVFQYNWTKHIAENGQILKDSVAAKGLVNPIIVAHSMGGLVSRAYIAAGGQITRLVTLGTPHLGTPLTLLGHVICFADYPGVQDMGMESSFITTMKVNANDVANRSKYFTIAGQVSGSVRLVPPGWVWKETYYSKIVKEGYTLIKSFGYDSDGLVPIISAEFQNGNTNNPLPLQQYIDHLHLQLPEYSTVIFNYVQGL